MMVTDIQRKILEAAWGAGGRYRVRQLGSDAKLEREACESLVAGDYARWISLGQPGIVLTDKALRLHQPQESGEASSRPAVPKVGLKRRSIWDVKFT